MVRFSLPVYGFIISIISASVPLVSFWVIHLDNLESASTRVVFDSTVKDLANPQVISYLALSEDQEALEIALYNQSTIYKRLCFLSTDGKPLKCLGKAQDKIYFKQAAEAAIVHQERGAIHVQVPIGHRVGFSSPKYIYAVASTQLIDNLLQDVKEHQIADVFQALLVLIPITLGVAYLSSQAIQTIAAKMRETSDRIKKGDYLLSQQDLVLVSSMVAEIQDILESYNNLVKTLAKLHYLNQQLLDAYQFQGEHEMEQQKRILAVVSHEMKTPLAVIRGTILETLSNLEMLGDTLFPKALDLKEKLTRILEKVDILQSHVRGAISLCRDGNLPIQCGWMNVRDWVEAITDLALEIAKRNNNRFEFNSICNVLFFYTDQNRLTQAVLALLDNAGKYTRGGLIALEIQADKAELRLEVSDTGKGIPKAVLEKIFDPFFRLPEPTPGLGIGLYVAKRNMEALGGKIEVESQGIGSRFRIRIPSSCPPRHARSADKSGLCP